MTVLECYEYMQERLNRLSTNSGDNIAKHSFVKAFNTMQLLWAEDRIKLNETNIIRTDETQQLLLDVLLSPVAKNNYYEVLLPDNYFHYKRSVSLVPCEIRNVLVKEGNINSLLRNENWKPSTEWGETLCTLFGNKLRVYVDNFSISQINLVYYRLPKKINMSDGYSDVNGFTNTNIDPEFTGVNLLEILNSTCALLAADTTDQWNYQSFLQRNQQYN